MHNGFEFTRDDLRSNQQGVLSARQKEWIQSQAEKYRQTSSLTPLLILGFLPIPLCVIAALFLSNESLRGVLANSIPMVLFGGLLLAGALAGSVLMSRRIARRQSRKFEDSVLMSAEGKAKLGTTFFARWGTGHYLMLDGTRINVVGAGIFEEGQRYRVFYARSSLGEFILSYEKI